MPVAPACAEGYDHPAAVPEETGSLCKGGVGIVQELLHGLPCEGCMMAERAYEPGSAAHHPAFVFRERFSGGEPVHGPGFIFLPMLSAKQLPSIIVLSSGDIFTFVSRSSTGVCSLIIFPEV